MVKFIPGFCGSIFTPTSLNRLLMSSTGRIGDCIQIVGIIPEKGQVQSRIIGCTGTYKQVSDCGLPSGSDYVFIRNIDTEYEC